LSGTEKKDYVKGRKKMTDRHKIKTISDLKKSGYRYKTLKEELRENLLAKISKKEELFPGIIGYDDTVIPELQNALLSKHDFILLGLRGQAKTRILRSLVSLLDEYIPVISGSEINDHPYQPISQYSRDLVKKMGDQTPVSWIAREQRYNEKLATPDVSIADLFGDIDPIKAATKRLHYADEGTIHFGIIPRTNRGIFVINELPDLQPRIQVGLLNILEEKDMQIRGYPLRIPLDILIAFSANPEDYTNRGNIITPLKDRIDSQIITHYPRSVEDGIEITAQEAWQERETFKSKQIPHYFREIVEYIAREARDNEYIDQKSGVSARLAISCMELLISNAERRARMHQETKLTLRISDLQALIPAITGKIELVYEGEQEGIVNVAKLLIGKAVKNVFDKYFPLPETKHDKKSAIQNTELDQILSWFSDNNVLNVDCQGNDQNYVQSLSEPDVLAAFVKKYFPAMELKDHTQLATAKEFVLEALYQGSFLSKFESLNQVTYKDLVGTIFNSLPDDDQRDIDYYAS
jgi:magnesium chelatase subunit I